MSIGGQVTGSVAITKVYSYNSAYNRFDDMPEMGLSLARGGPIVAAVRTYDMQCSTPAPAPDPVPRNTGI